MDLISNYSTPKRTKRQRLDENNDRKRLTLFAKKEIVQRYYNFLDDADETPTYNNFVNLFNKENVNQIDESSLGKWVLAEKNGEFLPWGGANDLSKKSCSLRIIADQIDDHLSSQDVHHGEYNQIAKSPSTSRGYGVIARQFTPAGTFLGYYKGECIDSNEALMRHDFNHLFCIGEEKFIDANKLLSCFARHYKCAVNQSDQNVCVERLLWSNPQKAICFIATKNVQKGEEFLISYGCEYSEKQSSKELMSDTFRSVYDRSTKQLPRKYQPQKELYSFQAQDMAREFRDDRSDSDDGW
jgi:hypothetical protein